MGLDTGFTNETIALDPVSNAGLELNIMSDNAPYIIKSPALCDNIAEVLKVRTIDHAIIPVRALDAATASRARVQRDYGIRGKFLPVRGGLWHTFSSTKQKSILAVQFTNLVQTLVENDIPITFLDFPRFTQDSEYLYRNITFLLDGMTHGQFLTAFDKTVRPEWVHQFNTESVV
jgi:hypothetical protein